MKLEEGHLKKSVNTIQIVAAVLVMYFIFPWLVSTGKSPYESFLALRNGVEYTGILETRPNEFGSDLTGIEVTNPSGETDFIVSDVMTKFSKDTFLGIEHSVFIDENGNQFWFVYEELVIIFFSLFVFFFFLRIVLSLLAYIVSILKTGVDNKIIKRTSQITLFFRPLNLLLFGFFMYEFSKYRSFEFKDEEKFFFIALYLYAAYTVFVVLRRLMRFKKEALVEEDQGTYANKSGIESVDIVSPTNNDLIKREKVKYKHQTSRLDK